MCRLYVMDRGGVASHSAAGKLISQTVDPHTPRCNRALPPGIHCWRHCSLFQTEQWARKNIQMLSLSFAHTVNYLLRVHCIHANAARFRTDPLTQCYGREMGRSQSMKVDAPPSCIDYCVPPSSTITKPPLLHHTWRAVY